MLEQCFYGELLDSPWGVILGSKCPKPRRGPCQEPDYPDGHCRTGDAYKNNCSTTVDQEPSKRVAYHGLKMTGTSVLARQVIDKKVDTANICRQVRVLVFYPVHTGLGEIEPRTRTHTHTHEHGMDLSVEVQT